MIKNTYTNIGDHLLMCDGVISPNGEVVKVSSSDKLILGFMYHRWVYFVKEENKEYRDSQEYIALRTGNSVKTVERCILKFHKAGVLLAEKRFDHKKKHNKWFWLGFVIKDYLLLDGDKIKEVIKDSMSEYKPSNHYKEKSAPMIAEIPNEQEYFASRSYIDPEDCDEWRSYGLEVVGSVESHKLSSNNFNDCPF